MNKFANLWPDVLGVEEPQRDLGYAPTVGLAEMVLNVVEAHETRNIMTAQSFKSIDRRSAGKITRDDFENHVRQYLVLGREGYQMTGQEYVSDFVDELMEELDTNRDGVVSWGTFSEWSRRNSLEKEMWKQIHSKQAAEESDERVTMQSRIDELEALVKKLA